MMMKKMKAMDMRFNLKEVKNLIELKGGRDFRSFFGDFFC